MCSLSLHMHQREVLIARPLEQAQEVAAAIARAGGSCMIFPTLEIRPIALSVQARRMVDALARYDIAVFISANAVKHGMGALGAQALWPATIQTFAVGRATAQALRDFGLAVTQPADGNDSEALLRLPALQAVSGKKVVIVRGVGGRELLAQALRAGGAKVDVLECYERRMPAVNPGPLREKILAKRIGAIVVSSIEALDNLLSLLDTQCLQVLVHCPLFVSHHRVAARAHAVGLNNAIVAPVGSDATVNAIGAYFAPHSTTQHS